MNIYKQFDPIFSLMLLLFIYIWSTIGLSVFRFVANEYQ
jgi:hypothetical protein